MLNETEIRNAVVAEIKELMGSSGQAVMITDEMKLNAHLHLTSLQVATLVALLEEKLGGDPFSEFAAITSIRTVGDLVGAYVGFFEGSEGQSAAAELQAAAQRAKARR